MATDNTSDLAYEIPSPYAEADLFDIKSTESADILYLAHRSHNIRKLSRTGDTVWTPTHFIARVADDMAITGASQANPCVISATGSYADFPNAGDTVFITGIVGMTQL